MSGAAQGSSATTKAVVSDSKTGEQPLAQDKKPAAQLEEDDEFEDFPVEGKSLLTGSSLLADWGTPTMHLYTPRSISRHLHAYALHTYPASQMIHDWRVWANNLPDWTEEETQIPGGNAHLWEESWDDDDTNEDFAVQLR